MSDHHGPTHWHRRQFQALRCQEFLHSLQLGDRGAARQVVESDEGVGLASAEVGLQLHYRVAASAAEPSGGADDQAGKAFSDVGATEELDRIAVFRDGRSLPDLLQVRGEFGDEKTAGGHVVVRLDHIPPRRESRRRTAGVRLGLRCFRFVVSLSGLLVEPLAQQFFVELVHLVGVWSSTDGFQQQLRRVHGPQGAVDSERFVVRPLVAGVLKF